MASALGIPADQAKELALPSQPIVLLRRDDPESVAVFFHRASYTCKGCDSKPASVTTDMVPAVADFFPRSSCAQLYVVMRGQRGGDVPCLLLGFHLTRPRPQPRPSSQY